MRFQPIALSLLRIAAGAAYFSHGGQKIFGWFGGFGGPGAHAEYLSRFGAAGAIEVVAGLLLILGLGTRVVAFIASGEMAVTYFWMHTAPSGSIWWWHNHGELPLLYCFIWLLFAAFGPGPISLDAALRRRGASR
ncbi:MAG: DoxX family protein [Bradyrhizobium sp.]